MPAKKLTSTLHRPSAARLFPARALAALALSALAITSWTADRLWPRHMRVSAQHRHLAPKIHGRNIALPFSNEVACAEIASFDDQLEAFLRYEYLRGRNSDDASKIFLTADRTGRRVHYKIFLLVENDQLTAVPRLNRMESHGLITHYELVAWTKQDLSFAQQQSRMFESAYNVPTEQKLENLPSFQLLPALADFLVFKSQTDWRVVGQSTRAPQPLTHHQALRLASDILDVAHFYNLPLDYFLGVGAMENNYMDVNGDLTHTVWKKRAERGDIVLERGRRRVLVSDYSIGTWQISRETLRAAHQLYLKDKRHYDELPPRLRPSRELDVNSVDSEVLTTYAGLVLRDLLDRFGGDVDQAIGAYNGGIRNPNPSYAAGVKNVALYARRVLEHAPIPAAKSPAAALPNGTVL
ncbi:MAG TPA: hypothetical protein VKH63_01185 [Candidatus Acidoferrum sp.]|nr:hypothetical protein [Candidatus Acidoferrum sp.]